jgi:hypothetical protein
VSAHLWGSQALGGKDCQTSILGKLGGGGGQTRLYFTRPLGAYHLNEDGGNLIDLMVDTSAEHSVATQPVGPLS